jgi:hypothetical protein
MDIYAMLSSLLYNDEYRTKALPHIKPEYFLYTANAERVVFRVIRDYVHEYNEAPTQRTLHHHYHECSDINEHDAKEGHIQWLLNETEKWIKNQAMSYAMSQCEVGPVV